MQKAQAGWYGANGVWRACFLSALALFVLSIGDGTIAWAATGHPVVSLRLAHLDKGCQGSAPITFGQPFRDGDVPKGDVLEVHAGDRDLPTQTDVKARNADGSIRHALITVSAPCGINRSESLMLTATPAGTNGSPLTLDDVLSSGFDDEARFVSEDGQRHLSARELLQEVANDGGCEQTKVYCQQWMRGPLASEWIVGAPPESSHGGADPHLMVFFAIRAYGPSPVKTVRVDTIVENSWSYADNPHNLHYSAAISVPGAPAFDVEHVTHYQHARWHHVLWFGQYHSPHWFAALNGRYLQDTAAIPSYQPIALSNDMLSQVRQNCAPMDHCDVMPRMEATGAQPQIGPLPQWSTAYIVNPNDYRAYRWMLADSDALGAYSTHFRDQGDDARALSLTAHPCATTLRAGEISRCPVAPHADDRLPACKADCALPLEAEAAHHGAPAYIAYAVTGDWYYEQELNLWANWLLVLQNPEYRGFRKGLVYTQQVRSQAWDLRTLGDAAYLLPDDAPLKSYFNRVVANNIEWYNKRYADNPKANALGLNNSGMSVVYPLSGPNHDTSMSPWQLSFFTWATGNLYDLGFAGAGRMRDYFGQFQLGTLNTKGFCPELASNYTLRVRDSAHSAFYTDFATVYRKTFPELLSAGCDPKRLNAALKKDHHIDDYNYPPGTMVAFPDSDTGFVANFQIGLAAAVASAGDKGRHSWHWFMTRPVRPDYRHAPQFAVVPTHIGDGS
ncbi:MAG: hypothetical protein WBL23_15210 [Salinisphaera sp.]|uniref:hypothetical protein n=1 Tax=Salinisphaera sp. TaxID=1914330 RepID=UPI003C79D722